MVENLHRKMVCIITKVTILVILKTQLKLESVNPQSLSQAVLCFQVNGAMACVMVKALKSGPMAQSMWASG